MTRPRQRGDISGQSSLFAILAAIAVLFFALAGFNTGALASVRGSTDTYARGQGLLNNGAWIPNPDSIVIKDYAFRTYVKAPATTPAPTTTEAVPSSGSALPGLLLPLSFILIVGGLLVPLSRRRQQQR